jgi:VWFA-related protein
MRTTITLMLLGALAQTPVPPTQPPVTFKVEVNYVEIDANVTDAQGNFVRSLTRDDFQVLEDGKPQALTAFSMVDIPIERVDPPLFSKTAILPDVVSNGKPFEGRVFVLVIDDLHTRFARTALNARRGAPVRRALRRR